MRAIREAAGARLRFWGGAVTKGLAFLRLAYPPLNFLVTLLTLAGITIGLRIIGGWSRTIPVVLILVLVVLEEGAFRAWESAQRDLHALRQEAEKREKALGDQIGALEAKVAALEEEQIPRLLCRPEVVGTTALLRIRNSGRESIDKCWGRLASAKMEIGGTYNTATWQATERDFVPAFVDQDIYFSWRGLPAEERYHSFATEALLEIASTSGTPILGRFPYAIVGASATDAEVISALFARSLTPNFEYRMEIEVGAANSASIRLRLRLEIVRGGDLIFEELPENHAEDS
jgi:hypothetical protein